MEDQFNLLSYRFSFNVEVLLNNLQLISEQSIPWSRKVELYEMDWILCITVHGRLGDRPQGDNMFLARHLGDTGRTIGRQQKPSTPHFTTGMQDCCYTTSGSVTIIWRLTLNWFTFPIARSFCVKMFRHKWSRTPKMGSIVLMLTAISHTCQGMTRLLSQLQPTQLRENLAS